MKENNDYRIPERDRGLFAALVGTLLVISLLVVAAHPSSRLTAAQTVALLLMMFSPGVVGLVIFQTVHVRVDALGIQYSMFGYSKHIRWSDVADVVVSSRLVVVRDNRGRTIKVTRADHYGLEPFDELVETVRTYGLPRARGLWQRHPEEFRMSYPPLSRAARSGYLLGLGAGPILLTIPAVLGGTMKLIPILLLVVGAIVISPFFVRDWLRTKRVLWLRSGGLACLGRRGAVDIAWEAVGSIAFHGPVGFGFGTIVVTSRDGSRQISLPGSIGKCGYILYWIQQKSGLEVLEEYPD